MNDTEIARVLALAAELAGHDDLEVITDGEPEPPELSGGLTPHEPIPVRVGGRTKRQFSTRSVHCR